MRELTEDEIDFIDNKRHMMPPIPSSPLKK